MKGNHEATKTSRRGFRHRAHRDTEARRGGIRRVGLHGRPTCTAGSDRYTNRLMIWSARVSIRFRPRRRFAAPAEPVRALQPRCVCDTCAPLFSRHCLCRCEPVKPGARGKPASEGRGSAFDAVSVSRCLGVRGVIPWRNRSVTINCQLSLAARGESLAAFDERCIPASGVAPPSNTPGILSRRALPAGRLARLGATPDFHHGLLET